jgi:multidrug efflux pump subunit AcrA (membrane-fusion protein)
MDLKISKTRSYAAIKWYVIAIVIAAIGVVFFNTEEVDNKFIEVHFGLIQDPIITNARIEAVNKRSISALTSGQVTEIKVAAGDLVSADTIIAVLVNREQENKVHNQKIQFTVARSEFTAKELQLESDMLELKFQLDNLADDIGLAKLDISAKKKLTDKGIMPTIEFTKADTKYHQLLRKQKNEAKRFDAFLRNKDAQLAAGQARVEQQASLLSQQQEQFLGLHIKAGMTGVLQDFSLALGQEVEKGEKVATVANMDTLIARIKIPQAAIQNVSMNDEVILSVGSQKIVTSLYNILPNVVDGYVDAIAKLPVDENNALRSDTNLRAEVRKKQARVYWLSSNSLFKSGLNRLYIKKSAEVAELTDVVLGEPINGRLPVLTEGIKMGFVLATDPASVNYQQIYRL